MRGGVEVIWTKFSCVRLIICKIFFSSATKKSWWPALVKGPCYLCVFLKIHMREVLLWPFLMKLSRIAVVSCQFGRLLISSCS